LYPGAVFQGFPVASGFVKNVRDCDVVIFNDRNGLEICMDVDGATHEK
jgi:hypothetical protein